MRGLPAAGADVIELGMPFTDPMADGPAIQAASLRALKGRMTLAKTLQMVGRFREQDQTTPVILMGYYNPIYSMGVPAFLERASAAGVDGLIIVDLPPEEDDELCEPALAARPALDPPGDADQRRRAPADRAAPHLRLRLLRLDHGHHRHQVGRRRRHRRRGAAPEAPHRRCRSRSASASRRPPTSPR